MGLNTGTAVSGRATPRRRGRGCLFGLALPLVVCFSVAVVTCENQHHHHPREQVQEGGCRARDYGHGSVVCVCDEAHCDFYDGVGDSSLVADGTVVVTTSTKAGSRFLESLLLPLLGSDVTSGSGPSFVSTAGHQEERQVAVDFEITFDRDDEKQAIMGFGGSFTDAASSNYLSLPPTVRRHLVRSYFHPESGIGYRMGRVPIGGSDFSWRPYTYDDLPDGETDPPLNLFSLQPEDEQFKIPFLQDAMETMEGVPLDLVASPWSAPAWMKTNNQLFGEGKLKPDYYQAWAEYFVQFFRAYSDRGVNFWGLTTQNEPTDGLMNGFTFNCMGYTPDELRTFIADHLGPTIKNSSFSHLKIITVDDQRVNIDQYSEAILGDTEAESFIDGIGVHWYLDAPFNVDYLTDAHDLYPEKFLIYTEACEGSFSLDHVLLGSWERAENYAFNIIEDLNHWVTGWIDWNLALDTGGGPNWSGNFVDAAVIVNATESAFYKQPMFYSLGHFSKFITEGSMILNYEVTQPDQDTRNPIQALVARRPDGGLTAVLLNKSNKEKVANIVDTQGQKTIQISLEPRSITSLLWLE